MDVDPEDSLMSDLDQAVSNSQALVRLNESSSESGLKFESLDDSIKEEEFEVMDTAVARNTDESLFLEPEELFSDQLEALIKRKIDTAEETHDPCEEKQPPLAAYHSATNLAEKESSGIISDLITTMKSTGSQDPMVERLTKWLQEREKPQSLPPIRVGVYGDSGVGKSSALCAALGIADLAATNSNGGACTAGITEYHHMYPGQKEQFSIKICMHDGKSRAEILRGYLRDFLHFQNDEEGSQDGSDEFASATALEGFEALFGCYPEFSTRDNSKAFLLAATPEEKNAKLKQMAKWSGEILSRHDMMNDEIKKSASNAEGLVRKLQPFIQTNGRSLYGLADPSLWPFVRLVSVGLSSPLLNRNLVIADLPGLSDFNQTRKKTTEAYIRNCDYVLIMAPIDRVLTNSVVQELLRKTFISHKRGTIMVCTKTDHIDRKTDLNSLGADSATVSKWLTMENDAEALDQELRELRPNKRKKGRAPDAQKGFRMYELNQSKVALRSIKKGFRIHCRNQYVKKMLQRRYCDLTGSDRPLPMAFISSTGYSKLLKKDQDTDMPLFPHETGIPLLRSELASLPAGPRYEQAKSFCQVTVPSVLLTLKTWSVATAIERQELLQDIVERPIAKSGPAIQAFGQETFDLLSEHVLKHIDKACLEWNRKALAISTPWLQWKAGIFRSFMSRMGCSQTPRQPYVDMNFEMLQPVTNDLQTFWNTFDNELIHARERCRHGLIGFLEEIRSSIDQEHAAVGAELEIFFDTFALRKQKLNVFIKGLGKSLDTISRNVRLNAVTAEQSSAMIQAMTPIYLRIQDIKGKGCDKLRKAEFARALKTGEPFSMIKSQIESAWNHEIQSFVSSFSDLAREFFNEVLEDFKLSCNEKDSNNPVVIALRKKIFEQIEGLQDGPMKRISKLLETAEKECKATNNGGAQLLSFNGGQVLEVEDEDEEEEGESEDEDEDAEPAEQV